uniref:hypothetical protein n=1 Tax=Azospirillum argentinense TaxID=2970906 RepID=UPI0010C0A0FC|nr:hypothetical protein [Azospirillum argentinense]
MTAVDSEVEMDWQEFMNIFGALVGAMVIVDTAVIYKAGKIKDFQISLWYHLCCMKPHYSARNIIILFSKKLEKMKLNLGIMYVPSVVFVNFIYIVLSIYFSCAIIDKAGKSNFSIFNLIMENIFSGGYLFVPAFIIIFVHSIMLTCSIWIIIYASLYSCDKPFYKFLAIYLIAFAIVFMLDVATIMFDSWIAKILVGQFSEAYGPFKQFALDYSRAYLGVLLLSFVFFLAPTLISFILSGFLTAAWAIVLPAVALAERVIYVQANDEKQGLFTYLATFLGAVAALINGIILSI